MKVLIAGASGFIGHRIFEELQKTLQYEVFGTSRSEVENKANFIVDFENKENIADLFQNGRTFNVIIWTAGLKDLRKCENDKDMAFTQNFQILKNFLEMLKENSPNSKLIYMSTDYVFDGQKEYYLPDDVPTPCTNYGIAKAKCEELIILSGIPFVIIRTSAVIGASGAFGKWLINELRNDKTIEMFSNSVFVPTPIITLIKYINTILNENIYGIRHITGGRKYNRYSFALEVKKLLNIENGKIVNKLTSGILDRCVVLHNSIAVTQDQYLNDLRESLVND